jgi:xanthosine utilization system XapX-like protein
MTTNAELEPQPDDAVTRWAEDLAFDQIRAGADRDAVERALVLRGVDPREASDFVTARYGHVQAAVEAQRWTPSAFGFVALAGLGAAVLAGIFWAWLVRTTGYEIGFVVWGLGLLAGLAVGFAARHRRGVAPQVIAVVAALVGIALGKYLAYVWDVREFVRDEVGASLASEITPFSTEMLRFFAEDLNRGVLSVYDFLWAGLAVVTAWKAPSRAHGLVFDKRHEA